MEDNNTITLTQAEFDAKVEEAVANATKNLETKHNQDMYALRQENKKLKDASKSSEDLKKEQDEETQRELTELRAFKKNTIIGERLAKEGLPSYFKNDTRLLNANDNDFDKVVKDIKKEYEATLPKGNPHSTVVPSGGNNNAPTSEKDKANAEFGRALQELIK